MKETFEYDRTGAVSLGAEWRVTAGQRQLVFGAVDGSVELISADDRRRVTLRSPLDDITLGRYLFELSGDVVTSYTDTGVELWTEDVSRATRLFRIDSEVIGLLADERIVGLDSETGTTLFEVSRPHEEFTDVIAVGGNGSLSIGSWSFLVSFDARGNRSIDENLDSTIEDVGLLGDTVVVALRDGKLVAFDSSGEQRWHNSVSASELAPVGSEWLPMLTDSGAVAVNTGGRIEQLEVGEQLEATSKATNRRILCSQDGSVLAITNELSAQVYERAE